MPSIKRHLAGRPGTYRFARWAHALALYLGRRPHEPDFAAFAAFRDDPRLFLDVGANIGQAAMSFRIFCKRQGILSIEPNPVHERDLRMVGRLVRRFNYLICAAGEHNGVATLHVPRHGELALTGEASLQPRPRESIWWFHQQDLSPAEIVDPDELPVQVRRLDDLELEPGFIKIDIEGSELSCLRGLRRTIERNRPIVMVERAADWEPISEFFGGLDYTERTYDLERGDFHDRPDAAAQNGFWIPRERATAGAL